MSVSLRSSTYPTHQHYEAEGFSRYFYVPKYLIQSNQVAAPHHGCYSVDDFYAYC